MIVECPGSQYDDQRSECFSLAIEVVGGNLLQLGHRSGQFITNVNVEIVEVTLNQFEWIDYALFWFVLLLYGLWLGLVTFLGEYPPTIAGKICT